MRKLEFLVFSIFLFFFILACKKRTQDERINIHLSCVVDGQTFPIQNKQKLIFSSISSFLLQLKFNNRYHNYQKLSIRGTEFYDKKTENLIIFFDKYYELINTEIFIEQPISLNNSGISNTYFFVLEFKDSYAKQKDKTIQFEIEIRP